MKYWLLAAGSCVLALLDGCQSTTSGKESPGAASSGNFRRQKVPEQTIRDLVERERAQLPDHWSVAYDPETQWFEIERKIAVLTRGEHDGAPDKTIKPVVGLRVVPYLAPNTWRRQRSELVRQLVAAQQALDPRVVRDETGKYTAVVEAQRPAVAEYNWLFEEFHALPDYHYRDLGFNVVWGAGKTEPFEGIVDPTVRAECRQVFEQFVSLLSKYEPAYDGTAYRDAVRGGGPQAVPGVVFCAYYDQGDEGVAFHDSDRRNRGSGVLNPADGSYLNEFRKFESLDISYTKQLNDLDSPSNKVKPPLGLLYVGWNEPGEWFKVTVDVAQAGNYIADLLYTAQCDGSITLAANDGAATTVPIVSTFDPAEAIPWRQWHHWNVARDAVTLALPKGRSVLTFRIATGGNMNLATLAFRRVGTPRAATDILAFNTPAPKAN